MLVGFAGYEVESLPRSLDAFLDRLLASDAHRVLHDCSRHWERHAVEPLFAGTLVTRKHLCQVVGFLGEYGEDTASHHGADFIVEVVLDFESAVALLRIIEIEWRIGIAPLQLVDDRRRSIHDVIVESHDRHLRLPAQAQRRHRVWAWYEVGSDMR